MKAPTPPGGVVCLLDAIEDGDTVGGAALIDGKVRGLILVRKGETVRAYVNSCPHTGAPLDFRPGKFLNLEKTQLLCANHMALFEIADGSCVSGPCAGVGLQPVAVEVVAGEVRLIG